MSYNLSKEIKKVLADTMNIDLTEVKRVGLGIMRPNNLTLLLEGIKGYQCGIAVEYNDHKCVEYRMSIDFTYNNKKDSTVQGFVCRIATKLKNGEYKSNELNPQRMIPSHVDYLEDGGINSIGGHGIKPFIDTNAEGTTILDAPLILPKAANAFVDKMTLKLKDVLSTPYLDFSFAKSNEGYFLDSVFTIKYQYTSVPVNFLDYMSYDENGDVVTDFSIENEDLMDTIINDICARIMDNSDFLLALLFNAPEIRPRDINSSRFLDYDDSSMVLEVVYNGTTASNSGSTYTKYRTKLNLFPIPRDIFNQKSIEEFIDYRTIALGQNENEKPLTIIEKNDGDW